MPDPVAAQPVEQSQPVSRRYALKKPNAIPKQHSETIFSLYNQGLTAKEIGAKLNLNGQSINGIIRNALKRGLIGSPGQTVPPAAQQQVVQNQENETVSSTSSPFNQDPPMNVVNQQPAPPPQDDFSGGRPIVGTSGGFMGAGQSVKYTVERVSPPDGLLGTHLGTFSIEELGQNYGSGTYKIIKYDPSSKFPMEFVQKIAGSYGDPRFPNQTAQGASTTAARPFMSRPWAQQGRGPAHEDEDRSVYRPGFARPSEADRAIVEMARQTIQSNQSGPMDKAIEMMANMHSQTLHQLENVRKSGPETMITGFLREQQEVQNERWAQERKHEEERRREEEGKWQRRQEEEQRRWEREQQAERDRHERELQRISRETESREKQLKIEAEEREKRATEERRFLLELEEKKIQLVRQEAEASQKRLEAELSRAREEMKEMVEKTTKTINENQELTTRHIEESQKQIQDQLDREREQLEREHKLKEKSLEKQHELEARYLDLQKEQIQNSGGDHIFNTIQTVIKEVSKGLEKVVDLKKLQSMTPEAHAAETARASIGTTETVEPQAQQVEVERQEVPAERPEPKAPAAAPAAQASSGNQSNVEGLIKDNLSRPEFQALLSEWALNIENCIEEKSINARTFANYYLEMMRDPSNDAARNASAAFATFMKPRSWKKMMEVFQGGLEASTQETFEKPEAEEFYKQFKAMVLEQIDEYWEQFLADRQKRRKGGNGTPAAQAPVEPVVAPQVQSAVSNGQTP